MNRWAKFRTGRYLSALDPKNQTALQILERRMTTFYQTTPYHTEWIEGLNNQWTTESHPAQMAMVRLIPAYSHILEVGCGDGKSKPELEKHVAGVRYTGIDLNPAVWEEKTRFVAGRANDIPFAAASFDVVISMYVVEHLVFPHLYLQEAWRVLKPGGYLLTIAPNFVDKIMPSERLGFSFGSGREKVSRGEWLDALLTFYDSRIRLSQFFRRRQQEIEQGLASFPILNSPRCLHLEGFTPDCDAVYPVLAEEIILYLQQRSDCGDTQIFHKDANCFGLLARKQSSASSLDVDP
jgi:SAM-dependent methyltransferase